MNPSSRSLSGPTPRLLRTAGHALWLLVRGGWETLVWGNVRAGSIVLAGTARTFRLLIRCGLWLTVGLLVMLLFSDSWRAISPLRPLVFYSDSLSGRYAPEYLVPVTLGLLALAWAYLLCGALHAHWAARLGVLALFVLFAVNMMFSSLISALTDLELLLAGVASGVLGLIALALQMGAWLVLLALLVLRHRRPIRLGLEFPLVLASVATLFFASYFGGQAGASRFELEEASSALQLTQILQVISVFLIPFLVIAGSEIAEFGMSLTRAVTRRLARSQPLQHGRGLRLWALALAAFLAVRLAQQWISPLVGGQVPPFRWGALAAALAGLGVWALWAARRRAAPGAREALPGWVIPVAGVSFYGVLFALQIVGTVAALVGAASIYSGSGENVTATLGQVFDFLAQWNEAGVAALAVSAGAVLGWRARRRGQPMPSAALFAWIFAAWLVWWLLTRTGRALEAWTFQYEHLDAVMTPVLLALLAATALARRLDVHALLGLTAAALLFGLLEFQDLLSNPLSPLFGLLGAEALLVSVSIFLGVMSAGNRFALNSESPRFPRYARGLLYFGYALLTVTAMNWWAAGHEVSALAQNEQVTRNGFIAIGLPLAFWALIVGGAGVLGEEPVGEEPVGEEPAGAPPVAQAVEERSGVGP